MCAGHCTQEKVCSHVRKCSKWSEFSECLLFHLVYLFTFHGIFKPHGNALLHLLHSSVLIFCYHTVNDNAFLVFTCFFWHFLSLSNTSLLPSFVSYSFFFSLSQWINWLSFGNCGWILALIDRCTAGYFLGSELVGWLLSVGVVRNRGTAFLFDSELQNVESSSMSRDRLASVMMVDCVISRMRWPDRHYSQRDVFTRVLPAKMASILLHGVPKVKENPHSFYY